MNPGAVVPGTLPKLVVGVDGVHGLDSPGRGLQTTKERNLKIYPLVK